MNENDPILGYRAATPPPRALQKKVAVPCIAGAIVIAAAGGAWWLRRASTPAPMAGVPVPTTAVWTTGPTSQPTQDESTVTDSETPIKDLK